jgi:hypothetical protein
LADAGDQLVLHAEPGGGAVGQWRGTLARFGEQVAATSGEELFDVDAAGEGPPLPSHHQATQAGIVAERFTQLRQLVPHLDRQGVEPLRTVEPQPADSTDLLVRDRLHGERG